MFFLPVDPRDESHRDPERIDFSVPRLARYVHSAWKRNQDAVFWVDIDLAIKEGLTFYQTRSNAIILQGTLPAHFISKVERLKTGEMLYERRYLSPRPPPKISLMINRVLQLNNSQLESSFNSLLEKHLVLNLPNQPQFPEPIEDRTGQPVTQEIVGKLQEELCSSDRSTLAETGAWTELLRMYVRDLSSREVDAGGDGTCTLQQSTTLKADTMRASDKMDSCNIRAAVQILQTSTRAPQNLLTAADIHLLVAVETDEREIAPVQKQCVAIKQAATKLSPPTSKTGKAYGQGCCIGGRPAVLRDWIGTCTQAAVPHRTARLWTAATIVPHDCGPKKPEPGQQLPQPCPRKLRPIALAKVLMKLTERCVIEQHIDKLLKGLESTNLTHQLGAWHARCGGADCAHCARLGERHGSGARGRAVRRRHLAN